MVQNKKDLKDYAIKCNNLDEKLKVLRRLDNLEFNIENINNLKEYPYILFFDVARCFICSKRNIYKNKEVSFLQFMDISKQFLPNNQLKKDKEKQQLPDFEVDDEGKIFRINNFECEKNVYIINGKHWWLNKIDGNFFKETILQDMKLGNLFISEESRDKALFKLEIEQQLRTIAHRLNSGVKIDWDNPSQDKWGMCFNYEDEELGYFKIGNKRIQGTIYCLSSNLWKEAIKEIGTENLKLYFK